MRTGPNEFYSEVPMHTYAQKPEWSNPEAVRIKAVLAIQKECRGLCPKDARAVLVEAFPWRSDSFFKRNLQHVLSVSAEDFLRLVGHSDPTGEMACEFIFNPYKKRAA